MLWKSWIFISTFIIWSLTLMQVNLQRAIKWLWYYTILLLISAACKRSNLLRLVYFASLINQFLCCSLTIVLLLLKLIITWFLRSLSFIHIDLRTSSSVTESLFRIMDLSRVSLHRLGCLLNAHKIALYSRSMSIYWIIFSS